MKIAVKTIVFLFAFLCLSCISSGAFGESSSDIQYYVSPDGNDSGDGSADKPYKTIGRTKKQLDRTVAGGFAGTATINISPGMYSIDAPLVFEGDGYASGKVNVILRGNGDGGAVISGGRRVTGWRKEGGNIWAADVRDILKGRRPFRDLFADGKRLTRSRYPNGWQMLRIESVNELGTEISLKKPLADKIVPDDKAELVVLQNWSVSKTAIDHNDTANPGKLFLAARAGFTEHPALIPKAGMACYLENAKAYMDSPGEWYLDAEKKKLYYFAAEGEDPNNKYFVAPLLEKLVVITGAENAAVKNITFENLSFEHTDFSYDSPKYAGLQASSYTLESTSPIYMLPAAIEVSFASNIIIKDCVVAHTGAAGIGIGKGSGGNRIEGCHIHDIGGNGINVGQRIQPVSRLDQDWEKPALAPKDNVVSGNLIEYCGLTDYGSVGIWMAFSQRNLITSNTVAHLPYTGVSLGFNWSPADTSMMNNTVEYNHIYDVMNVLADGGGIYTLGFEPGTTLRKNLIHEIHRSKFTFGGAPNNGIFFDEGSTGIYVEDIIIYGVQKTATTMATNPIRFNNTKESNLTWGKNYFGVGPNSAKYPKELEKEILDKAVIPSNAGAAADKQQNQSTN